jgi:hypothetical protein
MPIQNLDNQQSFPRNALVARPAQNSIGDKLQIENAPTTPVIAPGSLKTVFSQELKATLDKFGANRSNNNQNSQNLLQQYQKVTDFEAIDGLSSVIGIDVTV